MLDSIFSLYSFQCRYPVWYHCSIWISPRTAKNFFKKSTSDCIQTSTENPTCKKGGKPTRFQQPSASDSAGSHGTRSVTVAWSLRFLMELKAVATVATECGFGKEPSASRRLQVQL